jgi:hypothetical protein
VLPALDLAQASHSADGLAMGTCEKVQTCAICIMAAEHPAKRCAWQKETHL